MARCGCTGYDGCSCIVQTGGRGVTVTGSGDTADPYLILGPAFAATDSVTYTVTLTGDGSEASPLRWSITPKKFSTAGRPSAATAGEAAMIYDTTLHQPLWSDGTNWRTAAGAVV